MDELSEALAWPDRRWAKGPWPDPTDILPEFLDWTADPRFFVPQHHQAWTSLTYEALTSIDRLGTKLKAEVEAELLAARAALRQFDANLPSIRRAAEQTVSELIRALGRHPDAAWRDLVVAASQPRVSAHRRDELRDLLWATVRLAGKDPEEVGSMASGVVRDDAFSVAVASHRLGDATAEPSKWPGPDESAHLSPRARIDLVARLLTAEPAPAVRHIVWLAASPAQLQGPVMRLGTIELFEGQWVKAKLAAGDRSGLPMELSTDQPIGVTTTYFATESEFVLARIDLGTQTLADPIGSARFELRALLAAASFRRGGRRWKVVPGHLHVQDGRIVSWGHFDFDPPRDRPVGDSTATYLAELIRDLQGRRLLPDNDLGRLLREIDRLQEGLDHEDPVTVLNLVRLIELVNARVSGGAIAWSDFIRQQFEIAWVRQQVHLELTEVGSMLGVFGGGDFTANPADIVARYGPFREFHPDGTWTSHGDRLLRALPQLASIAQIHTYRGRRLLETARRLRASRSVLEWVRELRHSFELSSGRLQRVRDAIAHGGPTTRALDDAYRFCGSLTFGALGWTLEAMIQMQPMDQRFADEVTLAQEWLNSLATGPIEQTLFRP